MFEMNLVRARGGAQLLGYGGGGGSTRCGGLFRSHLKPRVIFNSEFSVNPPHVDGCGVFCRAQQHVGGPIPQSHHLVGVGLGGHGLGSGQTWMTGRQRTTGFTFIYN